MSNQELPKIWKQNERLHNKLDKDIYVTLNYKRGVGDLIPFINLTYILYLFS